MLQLCTLQFNEHSLIMDSLQLIHKSKVSLYCKCIFSASCPFSHIWWKTSITNLTQFFPVLSFVTLALYSDRTGEFYALSAPLMLCSFLLIISGAHRPIACFERCELLALNCMTFNLILILPAKHNWALHWYIIYVKWIMHAFY